MVIAVFKGWNVVRCNGLLQTQNMAFLRVKKNTNSAPHLQFSLLESLLC